MFVSADGPQHRVNLSKTLAKLSESFAEHEVTMGEVMEELGPQASALLIVFISLPFCAPVAIPGTSTPSGLISAWLAGRFALGLSPWLPKRLLKWRLSPKFFSKAFKFAAKFVGWLEKRIRPRWSWVVATQVQMRIHAAAVVIAAFLLALPMPPIPPLTNTIPALAVVTMMLGLIERDGLAVLIGWLLTVVAMGYFTAIAVLGVDAFDGILNWFRR